MKIKLVFSALGKVVEYSRGVSADGRTVDGDFIRIKAH